MDMRELDARVAREEDRLSVGDYVLATKWGDGDPNDQWCIGFYSGQEGDRHFVVDHDGKQFRSNGFRRAERISKDRGTFILTHKNMVEDGSRSLWWWKRCKMF